MSGGEGWQDTEDDREGERVQASESCRQGRKQTSGRRATHTSSWFTNRVPSEASLQCPVGSIEEKRSSRKINVVFMSPPEEATLYLHLY